MTEEVFGGEWLIGTEEWREFRLGREVRSDNRNRSRRVFINFIYCYY